ncbi:MAG: amidohydrolase family protein [Gemmatimonadota bacterium]|nr:amidohydrolase family protein [Gemmatimonadota bacterium]
MSGPPIPDGTVAVDGGMIAWVGPRSDAPAGDDRDLGDAALLPGLVNCHTHLELTVFRGLLEGLEFREWILTLQRAKAEMMSRESFLDSARLGVVEGLRAGVTTYADTCDSGVALDAMRELGARGIMYQEVFGPALAQGEGSLAQLREKLEHHRSLESSLQRVGVSPHAPYTVSDPLFRSVGALARAERLPVAIHIAESEAESLLVSAGAGAFADALRRRDIGVAHRARSPVALLDQLGLLETRPLLIHCVRVDAEDLATIARSRSSIAHCPASNARLGHGIAPLIEMLDAGIAVGLGSDSMASNNRMDILAEARLASLLQCARTGRADALSAARALELATLGGARALGMETRIGSLEPGKDADLTAFSLESLSGTDAPDPHAALVLALAGQPAQMTMVAGRELVRDGELCSGDVGLPGRARALALSLAAWRDRQGMSSGKSGSKAGL